MAFNLSPYIQSYPQLEHRFLKASPLMAVLYPGHPLALRKSVTYQDLAKEDFIIMQPKGRPNDEAEEVMLCYNRGGFVPNIVSREKEVQTVLFMVSAAFGIAILPEYAVRYYQDARNLRVIPMFKKDGTRETMDFEISWLTENQNPAVEKLVNGIITRGITE